MTRRAIVNIFDFDDTLFPTTMFESIVKKYRKGNLQDTLTNEIDSREEEYEIYPGEYYKVDEIYQLLDEQVCTILSRANKIGKVVIITAAMEGWVDLCMKYAYPKTYAYCSSLKKKDNEVEILYTNQNALKNKKQVYY